RSVTHGAGKWSGLVERGRKRDDAPTRAPTIGWLDPDDAGERRRLADRAAGIGAGRTKAELGCNCRRRTAGRTAGDEVSALDRSVLRSADVRTLAAPWVDHGAEARGLVRRTHREFVVVELAEQHGAVAPKLRRDRRLVGRHEI